VGRKSGQKRTVALVFLQDGERQVIVASLAGHDQNPAWYVNLQANRNCEVQLDRKKSKAGDRKLQPRFYRTWLT